MSKEEIIKEIERKMANVENTKVSSNGELVKIAVLEAFRECIKLLR